MAIRDRSNTDASRVPPPNKGQVIADGRLRFSRVLLYELLTGRPPFDPKTLVAAGLDEIRRIIREVDPPRPSTRLNTLEDLDRATVARQRATLPGQLSILLRGDLDRIVMRCLEKDRTRRYETSNGLAMDVLRHLHDEPVVARPPSVVYQLQKLVRRNAVLCSAAAAVVVALVAGTIVSTLQTVRANREAVRAIHAERVANEEAAISRAVSDFLTTDLLLLSDSYTQADRKLIPDPDIKLRTALDRASENVGPRFKDQPLTEAAVRNAIGSAYNGIGSGAKASHHHERALDLRRHWLGPEHPTTHRRSRQGHSAFNRGRQRQSHAHARGELETALADYERGIAVATD